MLFGYTWKMRGIVFLANIGIISIAIGVGFLASAIFPISKLLAIIIAVGVSFPINQIIVPRYLSRLAVRNKEKKDHIAAH